uniref:Uncharacterized protein n=1 Tax=viral metagenome TaxID=1070528 RepID=A0A6C0AD94_9ZZZZ
MSINIVNKILDNFNIIITDDVKEINIKIIDNCKYNVYIKTKFDDFLVEHLESHENIYLGDGPCFRIFLIREKNLIPIKTENNYGYLYQKGILGSEIIYFK